MHLKSVPMLDEAEHLFHDVVDVAEAAVLQNTALQDGEPDFDLVRPRRMLRRVDECEAAAVALVELRPSLVFAVAVNVEVVPNDGDRPGVSLGDHFHEVDEVTAGARRVAVGKYLTRGDVERSHHDAGAMARVDEFMSAFSPRGGRLQSPRPAMCKESFLVDTQHRSPRMRIGVQVANDIELVAKLWVLTVQPHANSMWTDFFLSKDATNFTDAESDVRLLLKLSLQRGVAPHIAERPSVVVVRALASQADELGARGRLDDGRTSRPGFVVEATQVVVVVPALSPKADGVFSDAQLPRDGGAGRAICGKQDDASSTREGLRRRLSTDQYFKRAPSGVADNDRMRRWAFDAFIASETHEEFPRRTFDRRY